MPFPKGINSKVYVTSLTTNVYIYIYIYISFGIMVRLFANSSGERGSIPGHNKDTKYGT